MADIIDTEIEIISLEKEIKAGEMPAFMCDLKKIGLEDRRDFVRFLNAVSKRRNP